MNDADEMTLEEVIVVGQPAFIQMTGGLDFVLLDKLAILSKESLGKILKKKGYQEGRQSSGDRETFWKGIKLKEGYKIDAKQETLDVSNDDRKADISCYYCSYQTHPKQADISNRPTYLTTALMEG